MRKDMHRLLDQMRELSPNNSAMRASVKRVANLAMELAAEETGQRLDQVQHRCRKTEVAWARHIAITLTKEFTGAAAREVQTAFGHFDHGTIRYALKKVRQEPAPKLKAQVEAVRMKLRGALAGSVMPDRRRPRPCAMKHLMEEKV